MRRRRIALLLLLMSVQALPALAVVVRGRVWEATYVAAYQPTFGPAHVPYSGTMKLKFDHGIVSGTYTAESVRPDPLYGRIIAVTGGVSEGHVTLNLQAPGGFTVRGTMSGDGEISGTATLRGSFYNFLAKVKSSP
jgi:hypothetical protein